MKLLLILFTILLIFYIGYKILKDKNYFFKKQFLLKKIGLLIFTLLMTASFFPLEFEFKNIMFWKIFLLIISCEAIGTFFGVFGIKKKKHIYLTILTITSLGVFIRYFIEFGEVSNVYNFTIQNVALYLILVPICVLYFYSKSYENFRKGDVMKKNLALVLSLVILSSSFNTVYASSNSNQTYKTNQIELDGITVTTTIENKVEHIVEHNSIKNTVKAGTKNLITGEIIYGPEIELDTIEIKQQESNISTQRATKIHQDTFLNYEYDIWTNNLEWLLQRPKGVFKQSSFKTYENKSNSTELATWKSSVDSLNDQEWIVIGAATTSIFSIIKAAMISKAAIATGGILTRAATASIIKASGAVGTTAILVGSLITKFNNCTLSYNAVKKATNNIH